MSVSRIDGTLEQIALGRSAAKQTLFKSATFRLADGRQRALPKFVASKNVTAELTPGASGRFYHFKAVDHQGIAGVRLEGGAALFEYPRTNERICMILVFVNLLWILVRAVLIGDGVPLLAVALMIFGGVFWYLNRNLYLEAKALFDGDSAAP